VAGFDGFREPPNLALLLAEQGREVEIITERLLVGENQDPGSHHLVTKRLFQAAIPTHTLTGLRAVQGREVTVFNSLTRLERALGQFDTVVLASGGTANDSLYRALTGKRSDVFAIGDCLAPRRVLHAVLEGARAGRAV
jgi:hypothetical protein